ncbi:low temperature requirement protein A [Virgisporangium aurantiacum]|uniref:Membrane protein n=1 Tax=Virgisporangium aurantiacum TaxID=175570 RepID=A0A8J4DZU1_9ACTN|nr:low temperature requirement protein A [Virgisporangium aurantiacum]GIJ54372.1 membrane protein [Virgisporangium aurantiacum]
MNTEARRRWLNPMRARAADEPHRVATPLELLFDLCFVVAVAQAALPLHHAISEDHVRDGVTHYLMVFFAIWWAWMNFTWFASAYDTDDNLYRITTLVQIAGALVLAAGVKPAFEDSDYAAITLGYVVMRLALVAQWLRAARNDPPRRVVALRYAAGITIVQVLWLAHLALPASWSTPVFVVLVVCELLVPAIAERAPGGPTTYHPHHIAERYGLFTIIVLGESVAAATVAVRAGLDEGEHRAELISVAVAGVIIVFALWWLYFDRSAHDLLTSLRASLVWGYGHYVIFAATAAIGAGLGVVVDHETHHSHVSRTVAGYAVAVPVALFLVAVWFLHVRPMQTGPHVVACPIVAALVLLAPLVPAPVPVIAGLVVVLVALTTVNAHGRQSFVNVD